MLCNQPRNVAKRFRHFAATTILVEGSYLNVEL